MDLSSISIIKSLCEKYHIRPSKSRGQNFVIDPRIPRMMADAADLNKNDVVLEIGPGFGTLTQELAKRVRRVLAVELDSRLVQALKDSMAGYDNVEIIQGDILKLQIANCKLQNFGYKVVANLPYSITSAILRKFTSPVRSRARAKGASPEDRGAATSNGTSEEPKPSLIVVMIQKEVAERVCAAPGEMSLLSVAVQFYGKPEIVGRVSRNSFWPKPEVESAILRIAMRVDADQSELMRIDEKDFFRIVRIGFSSRRKQLQNNLASGLGLPKEKVEEVLLSIGLDPAIRAQDLSLVDWQKLAASEGLTL